MRDNRSGQLWLNWLESNVIPLLVIHGSFRGLVRASDAHSYVFHGLVMHFAHVSAQHRSRICRIRCAD